MARKVTSWLTVTKSDGRSEADVWVVEHSKGVATLTCPTGNSVQCEVSDPLRMLKEMANFDPELPVLRMNQIVRITCSHKVRDCLPLWLQPVKEDAAGEGFPEDLIETIEDLLPWATKSDSHFLLVNDVQWIVVESDADSWSGKTSHMFAIPVGADEGSGYVDDWLTDVWASHHSCERASRTSGWDSSYLGLLTDRVVASADVPDWNQAVITLTEFVTPQQHFSNWINEGWLLDQLRSTWHIPDGQDDFIAWGFLQLAEQGVGRVSLSGTDGVNIDDMGVGLTSTTDWTFASSLDSELIIDALGPMFNSRPGGLDLVSRQENLADTLDSISTLQSEHDWIPEVKIPMTPFGVVVGSSQLPEAESHVRHRQEVLSRYDQNGARSLLGLSAVDGLTAAWKAKESLTGMHPDRFMELHDAYWVLSNASLAERDLVFATEWLEFARMTSARAMEGGWPASWEVGYFDWWMELGGTVDSAAQWNQAGWTPDIVLRSRRLGRYWNPPVEERVVLQTVPLFTSIDAPPAGVEPWPIGDYTYTDIQNGRGFEDDE